VIIENRSICSVRPIATPRSASDEIVRKMSEAYSMVTTIGSIYCYPVKGLSAEKMDRVALAPGECLPHDRRFALALGSRYCGSPPSCTSARRKYGSTWR